VLVIVLPTFEPLPKVFALAFVFAVWFNDCGFCAHAGNLVPIVVNDIACRTAQFYVALSCHRILFWLFNL
jgi:hypothetical protein